MKALLLLCSLAGSLVLHAAEPPAYRFMVEIPGIMSGGFTEVSGLSAEIEVVEYRDGTDSFIRKLPGKAKFGNITLKRGYIANSDLYKWWLATAGGDHKRVEINIHVLDETGAEVQTFRLHNCFVAKWRATDLKADGNDVAIEEITICTEGIDLDP